MRHARSDYDRIQDPAGLIPYDEPVFLIRGQDAAGPDTVMMWADLVEDMGGDREIVQRAREWATEMRIWQKRHAKKTPDMPADA